MYKLHVFSVGVKWIDINNHVKRYGKAVLTVPVDGMCFLTSVQMCMKQDLSIEYSLDQIKEKILNECKVIHVEYAYNHIQVTPVYNKQR